jgi:hypothetical protein
MPGLIADISTTGVPESMMNRRIPMRACGGELIVTEVKVYSAMVGLRRTRGVRRTVNERAP